MSDIITIDGPPGAGKTTLGEWIADVLGWRYLETGLLYRAAAWVLRSESAAANVDALLVAGMTVAPRQPASDLAEQVVQVTAGGRASELRSAALRTTEIDELVTRAAADPRVRRVVNEVCARVAHRGPTVVIGRDAGSAIAPDAQLKVHLHAAAPVLAARSHAPNASLKSETCSS